MKKGLLVLTIILAVTLALSGMLFAQAKKGPAADGKSVWDFIQKGKYQSWKTWPGTESQYAGPEPHGAFLTTYVNPVAFDSIKAKKGKFADGAMIVQDNFGKDKKLKFIDVMYKVKGYNPGGGDWFWGAVQAQRQGGPGGQDRRVHQVPRGPEDKRLRLHEQDEVEKKRAAAQERLPADTAKKSEKQGSLRAA